MKLCIVGGSGRLGQYMIEHALAEGHQINCVYRRHSTHKLDRFAGQITIFPAPTDDPLVIHEAVAGCEAVLTVLAPWGVNGYSTGTATAVVANAESGTRLVFSCGWHISREGLDRYGVGLRLFVAMFGAVARALRIGDINDQVEACRRIFASDTRWTVVRCSKIEEGASEGLPVWARHVGDPVLKRNRTRRIDFAHFMVAAVSNDASSARPRQFQGHEEQDREPSNRLAYASRNGHFLSFCDAGQATAECRQLTKNCHSICRSGAAGLSQAPSFLPSGRSQPSASDGFWVRRPSS